MTDAAVKKAKPCDKPIRMFDGKGLYLEVAPGGGKWWRLKYRYAGKEKLLSMGTYPDTSLKRAREKRDEARVLLESGVDPSAARKAIKASRVGGGPGSFEAVAREFHDLKKAEWSAPHAKRWLERLEKDVFPYLGALALTNITAPLLLETLRRVESRGVRETVHSIQQACGQVFRHGIRTGRADRNPAADLRGALKPVLVRNMAAVTEPKAVGDLMRAIADYQGSPLTRAALMLSALLFQRPGNVRAMQWSALDLDGKKSAWTIPASEMKRTRYEKENGRPHVVPLAPQAVAVLRELQPLTGGGQYVFPSLLSSERPMSENTVNTALRRLGYDKNAATAHGFRAMARTLLVEELNVSPDVIEAQLAHGKSGPLGKAYDRAEFLDQRRAMMNQWAGYIEGLRADTAVAPKRRGRSAKSEGVDMVST
ncbi:MAG: integrase arm-type DNA-binding domain-containing protein [Burkholderiaceae bacterium]